MERRLKKGIVIQQVSNGSQDLTDPVPAAAARLPTRHSRQRQVSIGFDRHRQVSKTLAKKGHGQ